MFAGDKVFDYVLTFVEASEEVKDMRLAVRAERARADKLEAEVTRLKESLRR